ncbi:outer membrane protein assembly factor BamD [Salegentibacter sp. HM20]
MFLQMKKKAILVIGVALLSLSCSEYQKVLRSEDTGLKYTTAEKLYNEAQEENSNKKYRKAARLLEQIAPEYRGKPQGEKLSFLFADSYYQLGDYYLSSYQFERFIQSYPNSQRLEEAAYKKAISHYHNSPRYDLDQADTNKAIGELQNYIDTFPDGEFVDDANEKVAELRTKLEKKAYEIAKQYHHTENYVAAMTAFTNFIADYPGSPFRELAYYYRFDSAYQYAINSYRNLMEERLAQAETYAKSYKKYFPEGEYNTIVNTASEDINSRLQNF